jgi:uncharacterized protein (DUF1810 family)
MWFVFPQAGGLGHSAMAARYAISSREEGMAYAGHPVLWPRLLETTLAVLAHKEKSANAIFASPDDLKFQSSMTLFHMMGEQRVFFEAIKRFYAGKPNQATIDIVLGWNK